MMAVVRRYIDLLLFCTIGLVAASQIKSIPLIDSLALRVGRWWGESGIWIGGMSVGLLAALGLIPIIAIGGMRLSHWRCHARLQALYPPLWLAALIAVAVDTAVKGNLFDILASSEFTVFSLTALVAAFGEVALWHAMTKAGKKSNASPVGSEESIETCVDTHTTLRDMPQDKLQLLPWIMNDYPIEQPQYDRFNFVPRAKQMAQLLLEHPRDTFGLTGPYGSGKTSFVKLVSHFANDKDFREQVLNGESGPNLVFSRVSEWGYNDKPTAAAVLQVAVDALSERVDCLAVASVPQRYVAAFERSQPPWWLAFLTWLHTLADPTEQLRRVDTILQAINIHLVLVIEDVDRNPSPELNRQAYHHLQSLLDRLQTCTNLTFILSAARNAMDFERLCTHKRQVPIVAPDLCATVVQIVRYYALRKAMREWADVDPQRSAEAIEELPQLTPSIEFRLDMPKGHRPDGTLPWEDICRLMAGPRLLKTTLRYTLSLWSQIHGEINFDDLLVCQIIRHVSPQAFDFVQQYYAPTSSFRGLIEDVTENIGAGERKAKQTRAQRIADAWNQGVTECEERDKLSIARLIGHVFGSLPTEALEPGNVQIKRFQSVAADHRYWLRMCEEYVDTTDRPTDQRVLKAILDWKQEGNTADNLVEGIETVKGYAGVFESFQAKARSLINDLRLSPRDVLTIADMIIGRLLRNHHADATSDMSTGFHTCCQLVVNHRTFDTEDYYKWLRGQVSRTLQVSLRLTLDIEQHWAINRQKVIGGDEAQTFRRWMHECFQDYWTNDEEGANRMANVLSVHTSQHAWALNHLVVRAYNKQCDPLNLTDWKWLVPVLERVLTIKPDVAVPAVCALFAIPTSSMSEKPSLDEFNLLRPPDTVKRIQVDGETVKVLLPDQERRRIFFENLIASSRCAHRAAWPAEAKELVDAIVTELSESEGPAATPG